MDKEYNILFVEDVARDAELMWRELRKHNINFVKTLVDNRDDYIDCINKFNPHIIISDYSLPQFNGMGALQLRNELTPLTPFIMVTGSINEEVAVDCMKAGADDYVLKENLARLGPAVINSINKIRLIREKKDALEGLKKSEQRFKEISENSGNWIWEVDTTGLYTFSNSLVKDILGYEPEEIVNKKHFYDFFKPEEKQNLTKTISRETVKKKSFRNFINCNLHKDGHEVILSTNSFPVLDKSGILKGYCGVDSDVSERIRAENDLRESEERYRSIISNIPGGVIIISDLKRNVTFIAGEELNTLGIPDTYFIGKHFSEILPSVTSSITKENFPKLMKGEKVRYDGLFRDQVYSITSSPLRNSEGVITNIMTLCVNITDRIKVEEQLRFSNVILKTQQEVSIDGILVVDEKANILNFNHSLNEIFNIPKEILESGLDAPVLEWVMDMMSDPEEFLHKVEYLYENRNEICLDEISLKDGRSIERFTRSMFGQDGKYYGRVWYFRDITNRKKAENALKSAKLKAEESDSLKTAFIHNISHEIRTPMNAITGFTALLGEPEIDKETSQSYIDIILQSSDHLLAIISDIMDISNIEANIVKIVRMNFNLNSVLKTLYEQFAPKAGEKNLSLEYKPFVDSEDVLILTDKTKLIQIISNLLSNAIKFTHNGYVKFGYNLKDDFIEFYVSDTGIGISAEYQSRVFERFFQVQYSDTRLYEGTGLGLSISKAYVELLGGKMWFSSEPGKGTNFYFNIPLVNSDSQEINVIKSEIVEKLAFKDKKTILVAEDVDSNFLLIKYFLTEPNINVLRAFNGKEAVEKCLSDKDIDLVLMDIKMPLMDGYTAVKLIRETNQNIPIIAQTAYSDDYEEALKCGCTDYIAKPFDKKNLLKKIKELLLNK